MANLDQATIDKCVARSFGNAADINAAFGGSFIDFFNRKVGPTPVFVNAQRNRIDTSPPVRGRFDAFWNQIPGIFGKPAITAIEFCALMAIGMRETSGNLFANPEKVGLPGHPGLAYAFDSIAGLKQSYNTMSGNRTALQLFGDPLYLGAHGTRPGRPAVPLDARWGGQAWPTPFPTDPSPTVNGFVDQADFYKFRGRGIIQTTGRANYLKLIGFILGATNNATLVSVAQGWRQAVQAVPPAQQADAIATVSSNEQWDMAFGESATLAAGAALHSAGAGNYLQLAHDAATLNGTGKGSLFNVGLRINGTGYANEVLPMMQAMIVAVAAEPLPAAVAA